MSCRPLMLKVLTLRTHQNISVIHKTRFLQDVNHNLMIKKCLPLAFVSTIKPKTVELLKKKKNVKYLQLWKGITIKELADVCQSDLGTIISIASEFADFELTENTKVESFFVLTQITSRLGKKSVFIANPALTQKDYSEIFNLIKQPPPKPENLVKRPPVVTIMGHVDHGKTTLLDALRNTFVVEQEFGGITQHIGAFSVEVKPGEKITFIDTPGHAAFTTLRSRGAKVTDIVVLIIAADDGIMDQTIESINIATEAGVPIIVAVNKIDKPTALTLDKIKEKLLEQGIQVEDKGGNVQLVAISALKKINLDVLVEVILVEAELMDLKGDPTGLVEGVVIESKTDKTGKQATVIVKRGTLEKGKIIVAGKAHARIRVMLDENGKEQKRALPSTPVQVLGWKELPAAGDQVFEVKSEKDAKKIINVREKEDWKKKVEEDREVIQEKSRILKEKFMEKKLEFSSITNKQERKKFQFENFSSDFVLDLGEKKGPKLDLIIKSDVHGSLEVILDVLGSYTQTEECALNVVGASVGDVKQNDIELAESSGALIFAFNVKVNPAAETIVKEKKINIYYHNILYKLIDDLKAELSKRIPLKDTEEVLGEAEVLENFFINVGKKKVPVAGSKCVKGELKKNFLFKLIRNGEVVYDGKVVTIKHHKTEVEGVQKNTECGLMLDSFSDKFEPGDKIVCYKILKVPQKTSWDPGF